MQSVTITDKAKNHLINVLNESEEEFILFGLQGGGCAGFEYFWKLGSKEKIKDTDEIIILDGNKKLIVDTHSIMYLLGSKIDYKTSIEGSMLIVDNPQAQSSCGCGVSVSL